jgi:anti-anti-sigma factor
LAAFADLRPLRSGTDLNDLGIKQRRVGAVTVLEANSVLRISLTFGMSGVSLERAVDSLMTSGQRKILLNLEGIKAIGAKGLGELVSICVTVTKGGGEFKLFNLTPTLRQLMSVTKLSEVFAFYDTEEEAIASFALDPASARLPSLILGRLLESEHPLEP